MLGLGISNNRNYTANHILLFLSIIYITFMFISFCMFYLISIVILCVRFYFYDKNYFMRKIIYFYFSKYELYTSIVQLNMHLQWKQGRTTRTS